MPETGRTYTLQKNRGIIMRTFFIISSLLFATMTFVGCENDGPAEEAGEAVDEAAQDVGNAIEDACEDVKEGAGASDQDC